MMTIWNEVLPFLALGIPAGFVLAALRPGPSRPLQGATRASMALAVLAGVVVVSIPFLPENSPAAQLGGLVRLDAVTAVMLALVCSIAVVITRYSESYLDRDPGRARYARAMMAALAGTSTLVLAENLLVIAAAWFATSLALHQLLTFYQDRPQALVAAHKKYILSRIADGCVLGALFLLTLSVGSLDIDTVNQWAANSASLPMSADAAAILLVLAVCLKSAQLPFHGWLTQVMEAPTPVSAFLHAGVINIGGFVLIRAAPFMAASPAAQALLLVFGTTTVVIAALIMSTRVSVKVGLAWSTSAQMGFMLVQCGLGAWHLALLHIVVHSLYKAHAFLRSGSTVEVWKIQAQSLPLPKASVGQVFATALVSVVGVAAVTLSLEASVPELRSVWPLILALGLSLAPFVASLAASGARARALAILAGLSVSALYCGVHILAGRLPAFPEFAAPPAAVAFVVAGFVLLFVTQVVMQARPDSRLVRALQPRLFAGLYLDEVFTRMTFRLWPPSLPAPRAHEVGLPVTESAEAWES